MFLLCQRAGKLLLRRICRLRRAGEAVGVEVVGMVVATRVEVRAEAATEAATEEATSGQGRLFRSHSHRND